MRSPKNYPSSTSSTLQNLPTTKWGHKWSKNTVPEVEFIMKECDLSAGDLIYDFGWGNGRHSLELAQKGVKVKVKAKEILLKCKKTRQGQAMFAGFE